MQKCIIGGGAMVWDGSVRVVGEEAKFQILIGIQQNSEFCWNLLPIRTEPRSCVPFFTIVISLEFRRYIYLDPR
jgi:hypothetical protein